MRWQIVLLLAGVYSFYQVLGGVPPKEDLCGMIVDRKVERHCLDCFTEAGHISDNPEGVRNCTATYLPPELAECSVPDAERIDFRINQGGGEFHNNHTNANYLPTCLTRRLRNLVKYQQKEERFVRQASVGVRYIMDSTLVKGGGSTMLSIRAMASIMQLPDVKGLVEEFGSRCEEKYGGESQDWRTEDLLENDLLDDEDELVHILEDTDELITALEDLEDEEEMDDEIEDAPLWKKPTSALGNKLPFGGTNNFSKRVLLYKCITSSLFKNGGAGPQLLEIVMQEDFFNPIPAWWVKPLLKTAKEVTEQMK